VKTPRTTEYAHSIKINGESVVKYDSDNPLKYGARLWIETVADVEIV
jgi:hypothetical protein